MIEVLRQHNGKLLLSVGSHCVETSEAEIEEAIDMIAYLSGVARLKIAVVVARETMDV